MKIYEDKINEYGVFTYPLNYCAPKIPGLGGIQWGQFISALHDIKYKGAVCVEIEDKAFEGCIESILASCKISYKHVNQFFE